MSAAEIVPGFEPGADGRPKFMANRLGAVLAEQTPFAKGGEQLYVYRRGVYLPGGEGDVRQRVAEALGDSWRPAHSDAVVTWLRDSSATLWDAPPLGRINTPNGILRLGSAPILEPHDPAMLSPVQIAATYDPEATCPGIDAFLDDALPGAAGFVHEAAGYLATPDNRYQTAVMCLGAGGGGKSTLLGLLRAFLGDDNVSAVALHQLEDDRFATADLYGRLANIFADLDARALRASSIFKSITGGDAIRGERKHRAAFQFTPYARLVFSANEAPPTSDSSSAFFDRWLVLPFQKRYRGTAGCDPDLLAKLTTRRELSGLLNHAIRGLDRLHARRGFAPTTVMREASETFKVDADSVAGFLADRTILDEGARTARPSIYQGYRVWCELSGRHPLGAQRVTRRVEELLRDQIAAGLVAKTSSQGTDYWNGIALREERS